MLARILALTILSLVARGAFAQDASNTPTSEARVHFDRGVELYREGSYDAALAEFERANQIAPTFRILYNLAQVQAERHEYVAAVKLLTEYLESGGSAITPDRRTAVSQDLEKLHQRIAHLSVEVNVDGAEVFVNDVSVGRSPLREAVLANVGTCKLRAEKTGYEAQTQTLTVAGADRRKITFTLVPTAPTVVHHTAPSQTTVKTRDMTPFWISFGAAVALGGATGVFGGLALGANHDLDQALDRLPADKHNTDSARSKLRTMAGLTDGFGAATIVAAGAAVYFLLAPPEHMEVLPASGAHARIVPTPTGVSVSGRF